MTTHSLGDPIAAAEEELLLAMLSGNRVIVDRLMDKAPIVTIQADAVTDMMADVTLFRTGRLRFSKLEPSELQVTRHPTSAVVSARLDIAGELDGEPFVCAVRFVRAWRKRPRGWRVMAVHLTPVVE